MRMRFAWMLGCATVVASAWAFDATSDLKAYLTAMIPKAERAFNSMDSKFFAATTTADFTEVEMGKTYNKKQSLAEMKQMSSACKSISCSLKLMSVKASRSTGTALTSMHMVAVMKPQGKDKKAHTMVMDSWETETWVRVGKIWKLKHLQETKPSKMTMDGKPYKPAKS